MAASRFDDPNRPASSKRSAPVRSMQEAEKAAIEPYRAKLMTRRAGTPADTVVHSFRPKQKPLWLMVLIKLQQGSSIVTLFLVAAILAVYGWTVYTQQRWGQQYDKLESLKKQERQLISANEVLKNQMAQQAENPTAGLLLPDPSNAIFLTPAPQRPEVKPKSTVPPAEKFPNKPLGY